MTQPSSAPDSRHPLTRPPRSPFGIVLGAAQVLLTTTYLVAVWVVARHDVRVDPDSWALVGAYVVTVCAAPLLLLRVIGTVLARTRQEGAGTAGTVVAITSSAIGTVVGLRLASLELAEAGPGSQGDPWALVAVLLVAAVVVPWLVAVVAHRAWRTRQPVADDRVPAGRSPSTPT